MTMFLAHRSARYLAETSDEKEAVASRSKNISNNSRRRLHKSRRLKAHEASSETTPIAAVFPAAADKQDDDFASDDLDPCQDGTCPTCFPED